MDRLTPKKKQSRASFSFPRAVYEAHAREMAAWIPMEVQAIRIP